MTEGSSESVAGAESVHNFNRNRRNLDPFRTSLCEHTIGSQLDDGDLASQLEESISGLVRSTWADGDLDLDEINHRDSGERECFERALARRVTRMPERRSKIEVEHGWVLMLPRLQRRQRRRAADGCCRSDSV